MLIQWMIKMESLNRDNRIYKYAEYTLVHIIYTHNMILHIIL